MEKEVVSTQNVHDGMKGTNEHKFSFCAAALFRLVLELFGVLFLVFSCLTLP